MKYQKLTILKIRGSKLHYKTDNNDIFQSLKLQQAMQNILK